jgi:CHAT domain-containing protein/cytochrome c-type biogenesis protein CcmH/NrfG
MACAGRLLAFVLIAAAPLGSAAATPPETPEALASRVLDVRGAQRNRLLREPEYASSKVARALLEIAQKAAWEPDVARADAAFAAAEEVARRAGADADRGRILVVFGNALYTRDLPRTLDIAGEAIRIYERLGDAAGQAEGWNLVGHVKHARADYASALAAYRKAHDLWTSAGDRRGVGRAVNNIGNVHRSRSEFDLALSAYDQALAIFTDLDDRRSLAVVTHCIGLIHFNRGEYRLALEYTERSLAMNEAMGERLRVAANLSSLGVIHRERGAYGQALELHRRSLKIREEFHEPWGTLESWNNIGLVYFSQGRHALAIDAYKRGLRLNKKMGGNTLAAEALTNIAAAAWRLGQRARAEANYRESVRICERDGYDLYAAESLCGLGRIALETGRPDEAATLFERVLGIGRAAKSQSTTAQAWNGLAAVSLAAGRPAEALERAQRAAEVALTYEQRELHWEAETLAGIAARRLGRLDDARRSFEAAVAVIEELRLEVGGPRAGERFLENKLSPYQELMTLALQRGASEEALELAERSKARVLADLVHRADAEDAAPVTEADRAEEGRLRVALGVANRAVQEERRKETPDEARIASLEGDRQARRSAYEAFQVALQARQPDLALQRGRASPFRFAEAGSLLPRESVAVLEYAVTEQSTYVFVLTAGPAGPQVDVYTLGIGRERLAARARRLRERLAARDLAFGEDARPLYDLLLGPARARLAGKTQLVVVPDGPLWEVPFQSLQDRAGQYLIEAAAISYAPSLTVLRESLRRRPHAGPPRVLAMGQADFGAKGGAPAASLVSDLGPLPDAERQVREIAALYGPERSTTYLGRDAREDTFKAEAPRHSVVHLATHGVLDETSPLYSHVVLSPGTGGSSADGLLEAWEMARLALDADLVVLSACETGRGRIAPGEGLVGTAWSLLVAGSRSLVVSQWKVESESTTELMTAFHRGLAQGEGDLAAQLRAASLELLRRPRYAHPFYWAGFVLVGNPY